MLGFADLPVVIEREACLDLAETEVWGWEKVLSAEKIQRYRDCATEGVVFPSVNVVDRGSHFLLAHWVPSLEYPDVPDGGHHRTRSFFEAGLHLPVSVLEMPPELDQDILGMFEVRNIRDILMVNIKQALSGLGDLYELE